MLITPPTSADYGFYNGYISKAPQTDLVTALHNNWQNISQLAQGFTAEQLELSYAEGKWSIKEILMHLVDGERNFCYRIMRISRNEQNIVPVYNIHDFIVNAHVEYRSAESIMEEYDMLRKASIVMFKNMHPDMLDRTGQVRDTIVSVRALGFAMVGHVIHHMDTIKEKYLLQA
jgi:hypothetical protein